MDCSSERERRGTLVQSNVPMSAGQMQGCPRAGFWFLTGSRLTKLVTGRLSYTRC